MPSAKSLIRTTGSYLRRLRQLVSADSATLAGVDQAMIHLHAARLSWTQHVGPDDDSADGEPDTDVYEEPAEVEGTESNNLGCR